MRGQVCDMLREASGLRAASAVSLTSPIVLKLQPACDGFASRRDGLVGVLQAEFV